jgi:hypothetical protein
LPKYDYSFYIYTSSAVQVNDATYDVDMTDDFSVSEDRFLVRVTDDDGRMHNTGDSNQIAEVYTTDGDLVTSGPIEVPHYHVIQFGSGGTGYLDKIEVNGMHVGYTPSKELEPGETYNILYTGTYKDTHSYYEKNSVQCFAAGTRIATTKGNTPVESLRPGDRVLTLDHGPQPVRWIGGARVSPSEMQARAGLRPWALPALPGHRPLRLSAQHRVLIGGARVELLFGADEVFAPVQALETAAPLAHHGTQYWHILCAAHEIIWAEGYPVETLLRTPAVIAGLPHPMARQLQWAAGGDALPMRAARLCLSTREAHALWSRPRQPVERAA